MFKKSKKTAFTLVELLVVIAIIGILSTLAVISLQNARSKARDAKRVADVRQIQTALELYYSSEGEYPDDLKVGDPIESSDGAVYMPRFPKAPNTVENGCDSSEYHYEQKEAGASYEISFCLGSKIGDLEAGNIITSPGGISEGPTSFTCGDDFVDLRDEQSYPTVRIGTQCWMAKNLNIGTRINSCKIGPCSGSNCRSSCKSRSNSEVNNQINNGIIEKYCYNDDESNCDIYGGLYQWDQAVNYNTSSSQGICPLGWHLPTVGEWTNLENYLKENTQYHCGDNSNYIAKSLAATTSWETHSGTCTIGNDLSANNKSGFTALPATIRSEAGNFDNLLNRTSFWSTSLHPEDDSRAWYRSLDYNSYELYAGSFSRASGFSVRCLLDE